jgi:ribose 5-phosphate isomerase B
MRVFLGSDHAGFELKAHLLTALAEAGHEPVDCGATEYDAQDDYPPYCFAVGERVVVEEGTLGVVIGGSGNGEQIAANKVPGVRAALAWNEDTARLAREHNDANVVAVGARQHSVEEATALVTLFLATEFSGDPRHERRIAEVAGYERDRHRPAGGLPTR